MLRLAKWIFRKGEESAARRIEHLIATHISCYPEDTNTAILRNLGNVISDMYFPSRGKDRYKRDEAQDDAS